MTKPIDDFPKPITGTFLTNEQAEQFKNVFKDFVQVIRCKDCKWNSGTAEKPFCMMQSVPRPKDWFCAEGER